MSDDEDIPIEFQCTLIRLLDRCLKQNKIKHPKRRKIVEDLCFALSDHLDGSSVEVKAKEYVAELSFKRGKKRCGVGFPYHEYAHSNVDWYYDDGGDEEFEAREREEEKHFTNVRKADASFPASGHNRLAEDCHHWRTEAGYIFAGWLGGLYQETGEAFVWAEYFRETPVFVRVRQGCKQGDWCEMQAEADDPEKRMMPLSVAKGVLGIQYRIKNEVFPEFKVAITFDRARKG